MLSSVFLASRIDAFAITTRSRSMSEVESTSDQTESNEPLWQVQLASGQVCRMTLELLDDAFQDGLITENTLIMQDGTTEWVTLRASRRPRRRIRSARSRAPSRRAHPSRLPRLRPWQRHRRSPLRRASRLPTWIPLPRRYNWHLRLLSQRKWYPPPAASRLRSSSRERRRILLSLRRPSPRRRPSRSPAARRRWRPTSTSISKPSTSARSAHPPSGSSALPRSWAGSVSRR